MTQDAPRPDLPPRPPQASGYREIAATLIRDIQAGTWPVGGTLPSEADLATRFGAGRNTIREALRQIQELGFIQRRRGARSVIAAANPDGGFVNSVRSIESLLHYAKLTRTKLLTTEQIRADDALARRLEVRPGSDWLRIAILRSGRAGGDPICFSEIYIEPRFRDILPYVEGELTVYSLIEQHHNLLCRRVEQETEAAAADEGVAERLNVAVGSPILLVRTKFYDENNHLIEVGLGQFPAGRYRVRMSLERRTREG